MLELERAQVGVDLLGVVVAQLRIANVQRVKIELRGLYRHRLTAAGLLRQKLLLLERLALSRGALPRHAHIGWVGHGRDAPPPRALSEADRAQEAQRKSVARKEKASV